jgi:hypothetical protein
MFTGHSLPASSEVKNAYVYTSTPSIRLDVACLIKYRDNFTATLNMGPKNNPFD